MSNEIEDDTEEIILKVEKILYDQFCIAAAVLTYDEYKAEGRDVSSYREGALRVLTYLVDVDSRQAKEELENSK